MESPQDEGSPSILDAILRMAEVATSEAMLGDICPISAAAQPNADVNTSRHQLQTDTTHTVGKPNTVKHEHYGVMDDDNGDATERSTGTTETDTQDSQEFADQMTERNIAAEFSINDLTRPGNKSSNPELEMRLIPKSQQVESARVLTHVAVNDLLEQGRIVHVREPNLVTQNHDVDLGIDESLSAGTDGPMDSSHMDQVVHSFLSEASLSAGARTEPADTGALSQTHPGDAQTNMKLSQGNIEAADQTAYNLNPEEVPHGLQPGVHTCDVTVKKCDHFLAQLENLERHMAHPAYSSVYNTFRIYQTKINFLTRKLESALKEITGLQLLMDKTYHSPSNLVVKTELLDGEVVYQNASTQTVGRGRGRKAKLLTSSSDEETALAAPVYKPSLKVKIIPKKRRVKRTPRKKLRVYDEEQDPEYLPTYAAGFNSHEVSGAACDDVMDDCDDVMGDDRSAEAGNAKEFACFTCNMKFDRPKDLKEHLQTHEESEHDQLYPCPMCDKSYLTKKGLKNHERSTHGIRQVADTTSLLRPHACSVCPRAYTSKKGLRKHYNSAHQDSSAPKPFPCDECGKSFNQQDHLDSHKRWHRGEKPYECVTCSASFARVSEMKSHMAKEHGDRPYKCNMCESSYSEMKHLRRHKMTHNPEKAFICDVCGKAFSRLTRLNAHQRTHSGVRPYVCDVCNRAFTDVKYLLHHKRTHSGEKPFCCDICGKMFAVSITLMQHRRTHTGERPYQCDQCDMSFTTSSNLNRHKRRHSGAKPFSCPDCGKAFSRSCDVTRHQVTHTGVKPFKCEFCNICFGRRSHLVRHQKKHGAGDAAKQQLAPGNHGNQPPPHHPGQPEEQQQHHVTLASPPNAVPHGMAGLPTHVPITQISQLSHMLVQQAAAQQSVPGMQNFESVIPAIALQQLIPEHKYPHEPNRTVYYQ